MEVPPQADEQLGTLLLHPLLNLREVEIYNLYDLTWERGGKRGIFCYPDAFTGNIKLT